MALPLIGIELDAISERFFEKTIEKAHDKLKARGIAD
jgi:hypothetical protein